MSSIRISDIVMLAGAALLVTGLATANPRAEMKAGGEATAPVTDPAEMGTWLKRLVGRYSVEGAVQVALLPEYEKHQCGGLPPVPDSEGNLPPPPVPYCSVIHGNGDCIAVGSGPGVHCILDITWSEIFDIVPPPDVPSRVANGAGAYELPGFVPYLRPAVALYGLDTERAGINHLLVDHKGLPEGGLGFIAGDRSIFRAPCVNAPATFSKMYLKMVDDRMLQSCERVTYIDARQDSKVVHISIDIEINERPFTRIQMTLRRQSQVEAPEAR